MFKFNKAKYSLFTNKATGHTGEGDCGSLTESTMARNVLCLWTCGLISVVVFSDVRGDPEQQTENTVQLHEKNNDFAFRLYKSIAEQPDAASKNVFFSPLSVSVALAAISLGAGGETHQQLFSGLGFNTSAFTNEDVHQAFLGLLRSLNQRTGVDLEVGTALYVQNTFKPLPEFLEKMKRFYLSDGFSVDFTKTVETTEQMNKYVSEKTRGKITQFINDLDPATLMYLLSYIYFKGKWSIPFDPSDTKQKEFNVNDETTVPVQMMNLEDTFEAYHDKVLSTQVLALHYNESFSMILALPDKSLSDLEKAVSPQHLTKWLRWMDKRKYQIYIPKFSIKTSCSLKNILTGMGMKDMFTEKADFTGISSEKRLLVSEAVHQASLDVDETGATATGVTGISFVPLMWIEVPILNFNRPFMIFIIDKQSKIVLFMGKIVNPSE